MIELTDLPHLNAALNGATIVFLAAGIYFILNGARDRHRACMIAALAVSVAFLASYLTYHFNAGLAKFGGEGAVRPVYFTILIVHIVVAAAITPLVPLTAYWALRGRFQRHKRIARWTWPLWMFVAVTGVVVYVMAIHMYPDPAGPYASRPAMTGFPTTDIPVAGVHVGG